MTREIIDFYELLNLIDREAKRLNWDTDKLKEYVLVTYGKKSRYFLTDSELIELHKYLKSQPSKKIVLKKKGLLFYGKR